MTTLYNAIVDVANRKFKINPQLSPGEAKCGALMDDLSRLVQKEATERYPDQPFQKTSLWVGGRCYSVRAYPEFMIQEFINDAIKHFIEEHQPFDVAGRVVYSRYIPTKEERAAKNEQKLMAKYGEAYKKGYKKTQEPPSSAAPQPDAKRSAGDKKLVYIVSKR